MRFLTTILHYRNNLYESNVSIAVDLLLSLSAESNYLVRKLLGYFVGEDTAEFITNRLFIIEEFIINRLFTHIF